MIPAPGEPPGQWWGNTGFAAPAGLSETEQYFNDVTPELAKECQSRGRDQVSKEWDEPWPLPAHPDIPTHVLLCRDDRFFVPDFQRRVARDRLGITPDEIDGGHCVALSRPAELADRLISYL
jgi:pimeloyl-ACP methyl ester carboxylesterase